MTKAMNIEILSKTHLVSNNAELSYRKYIL